MYNDNTKLDVDELFAKDLNGKVLGDVL